MCEKYCANKLINFIAKRTLDEVIRTIDWYDRKFNSDIALLNKLNIQGLYNFTNKSAKMEEEIKEDTTDETKKLMKILEALPKPK